MHCHVVEAEGLLDGSKVPTDGPLSIHDKIAASAE